MYSQEHTSYNSMKILSYQSFSLYANGGGSRILRRLYKGREANVFSLAIEAGFYKPTIGAIAETIIPAIPLRRGVHPEDGPSISGRPGPAP